MSLNVIATDMYEPIDPTLMISYYRSIVTMSLSRTLSEINGDFSRKQQNFPVYLTPPLTEFPLDWTSAQGSEKLE